jgi:hypothetical protein
MSKKKRPFTEEQPIEGEAVLFCVHEAVARNVWQGEPGAFKPNKRPDRMHFFKVPKGMPFRSPCGEQGLATWVIVCSKCYRKGLVRDKFLIGGDGTWKGNREAIRESKEKK